ncbi:hypothetical protein CAPTEDRAFT_200608 [Capitella teleta]|uniref:Rieske domain-containing protein n=1 Tax=Capitella teleta TaxID=283909 RepID=R7TIU9_CAPTE|nr:hypothetical protein CAPTEDRAFT_200608 [Capitella teleta]|eukprot:ELT91020.1 hypothetical protein CAPTEDRAFT_200608 [Capitella teleta]
MSETSESDQRLYFDVEGVTFNDLLDWSDPLLTVKKPAIGRVKQLRRQNSRRGSLFSINETELALFRYGSEAFAIKDKCPHLGGPLHVGDIEVVNNSPCVRCPWHSWCFDLHTGVVQRPQIPSIKAVVYPVKVTADGILRVGFNEFHPSVFETFNG